MADLIDRQAAINALWKALYDYEDKMEKRFQKSDELDIYDWIEHRVFVQNMSDIDRQVILALPPAEPERKKGKWIWDDEGYHCSECFFHAYGNTLECIDGTYKYCPNCGKRMEEEDD